MAAAANRTRRQHDSGTPARDPDPNQNGHQPHDHQAEQALIGALLATPHLTIDLDPGDLYEPNHATIWHTIRQLVDTGQPADLVTVTAALLATGDLVRIGGAPYLHDCMQACPTPTHASHYAAIIRGHARTRRAIEVATRLHHQATTGNLTAALDTALTALAELANGTPTTETDTWQPIDLQPALTGGILTPPAALLARDDGTFLLYPGRLHSIAGEPESGKTWVALIAVAQALEDNQHVIYLDFEDTPEGIVGRLLALGANPTRIATHLHYIRPDRPIDQPAKQHLAALVDQHFVTLAIIDGVTEAMTLHGLEPLDNADAATFYEQLPRYLTHLAQPPAVLLIDHVPKDEDRPKRYAIGAQHKLAGLDGAAYVLDIIKPFAPGTPGISRLRIAKDRPGQVRRHARGGVIAELHIDGDDLVVRAELTEPRDNRDSGGVFRPTIIMERISRYVQYNAGITQNAIESAMKYKRDHVRLALELLTLEGYLAVDPGPRGARLHRSQKPFRIDEGDQDD